jgi:aspartyl-tRNA(Asn)/glutamyl-tRNA(Gln) amidotransferase subunit B
LNLADVNIEYEAVIGLEIHAQLATQTKMFCGCRYEYGAPPNSLTCPVCLGHPGALPVANKRAVEYALRLILAVGGEAHKRSVFARKNYFYPDLPKGYQITQYDRPLGIGGRIRIEIDGDSREIALARIHLEEDAGKLIHPEDNVAISLVDYNRCGSPLLEIVTEPVIHSPAEAHVLLTRIKQLLQYLDICSGDMEKGALRCDANISIRPHGEGKEGVRTELKNLNSFKAVERALSFEIERQTEVIRSGGAVIQETLLWDEKRQMSEPMRGKEESEDYRYFPEPDLKPLEIDDKWIESIRSELPELPDVRRERIGNEYSIPRYDATVLTESRARADYFEAVAKGVGDGKLAANWVMGEVLHAVNDRRIEIEDFLIKSDMLVELLWSLKSDILSGRMAKAVFDEMAESGKRASDIMEEQGLKQITGEKKLAEVIGMILQAEPELTDQYRNGKEALLGYFVGKVMEATGGKAHPGLVNKILKEKLDG